MSQINVNRIKDSNKGAPDFPSGVNVGGITSTVTLGVTNLNPTNLNVSGVVTATTLDGNLLATGTPTLGLGVTINTSGVNISGVATAGIVSATTLYGNGANITGIALTIAPLNYNPALNSQASHIAKASGIGLTFNQAVKAGSGNVTLSLANAGVAGTVVENFGVGNSVTYSNGDSILITPTADLSVGQNYHLSYPSGAFTNIGGDVSYVGTAYTFQARSYSYQAWVWGDNEAGQLGQNNEVKYSSPVQIPGNWTDFGISGGGKYGAAINSSGELWAWGNNYMGQLGQNQGPSQLPKTSSPVQIGSDTTWSKVELTNNTQIFASKTDGTLWSWGYNAYGQLGHNNRTNYSSPVQIPGTTWTVGGGKLTAAAYNVMGVKTDGTLWSWGYNANGSLGHNNRTYYSSPTQIPGTNWASGALMGRGTGAIKTDGTLWTWGSNGWGELGIGVANNLNRSSPVQVPGTTWALVGGRGRQTKYALRTDGTMWGFGDNVGGVLGQNDETDHVSPIQIPGTTWVTTQINRGEGAAWGIKTDGTLWGWGDAGPSQRLGQNAPVNSHKSSPTQIPGTTWHSLQSGYSSASMGAIKRV